MNLDEKIRQMFMMGFKGERCHQVLTQNEQAQKLIKEEHVGGIILFDRNVAGPEQVTSLINELQRMALLSGVKIPLFIVIDQDPMIGVRSFEENPHEVTGFHDGVDGG
jgi:beta-N-acetylhexosaminidase